MLTWKTIATGSGGNCYLLKNGDETLIIEAGISLTKIKKALEYDFRGVKSCLVTHEHGDHAGSATKLAEMGVDIYASAGTLKAIGLDSHRRAKAISHAGKYNIAGLEIQPFNIDHRAAEPLGFYIQHHESKTKIIFATDLNRMRYAFRDINFWFLECNHDVKILSKNIYDGKLHPSLMKIKDEHYGLNMVKDYVQKTILPDKKNLRKLRLIHPSKNNFDKEQAEKEIKDILKADVSFVYPNEEIILTMA